MEYVKKSIDERALHKREYDTRVNERQMQKTEGKVDTSTTLDASLIDTESSVTESKEQDTSSKSGNDVDADDADIKPVYDKEPMAEVQMTAEIHVFATGKQHTEQPEFNNEGEVDQNAEQCHDTRPLPAKLTDNQITELSNQSLKSENICLKKTVAQWVPTGKIFTFSTTKVDSEPPHGSNTDITNLHECKQTLDSSAGTSINVSEEQNLDLNAGTPFNLKKKRIKVHMVYENLIGGTGYSLKDKNEAKPDKTKSGIEKSAKN
ncbi:hypothetical protein Tco_0196664 [Tanacetum coccineum]